MEFSGASWGKEGEISGGCTQPAAIPLSLLVGGQRDREFKAKIGLKSRKQPPPVVWWDRARARWCQHPPPAGSHLCMGRSSPNGEVGGLLTACPSGTRACILGHIELVVAAERGPCPILILGMLQDNPMWGSSSAPPAWGAASMAPTPLLCFAAAGDENLEHRPSPIPKKHQNPFRSTPSPRLSSDKDPAQKPQGSTARARGSALQWSAGNKGRSGGRERPFPAPGTLNKPQRPLSLCQPRRSAGV